MPRAADDLTLQFLPFRSRDAAGLQFHLVSPTVGTRTELLSAPVGRELRSASDQNRGDIGTGRSHQQRRDRLVAASQQHDSVEWIRADRLLDVHAHQVPEQHRCWTHEEFAQRHHWKLEREAAGLPHTTSDGIRQRPRVRVAVRQLAPGVADADDGLPLKASLVKPCPCSAASLVQPYSSGVSNHSRLRSGKGVVWSGCMPVPRCSTLPGPVS